MVFSFTDLYNNLIVVVMCFVVGLSCIIFWGFVIEIENCTLHFVHICLNFCLFFLNSGVVISHFSKDIDVPRFIGTSRLEEVFDSVLSRISHTELTKTCFTN